MAETFFEVGKNACLCDQPSPVFKFVVLGTADTYNGQRSSELAAVGILIAAALQLVSARREY